MSKEAKVWIGLFRGVNVGGNNKLPMKELVKVLEAAGLSHVKTYIASGNIVFRSPLEAKPLEALIEDAIQQQFGFRPSTFVITLSHIEKLMKANPFRDHEHQGKAQHFFFLKAPASKVDHDKLESLKADSEAYDLTDEVFYFYAPEGVGRSKLIEKLSQAIKADMTARNLNTVETLRDMAVEMGR